VNIPSGGNTHREVVVLLIEPGSDINRRVETVVLDVFMLQTTREGGGDVGRPTDPTDRFSTRGYLSV
jgi:hypothetical protein